MRSFLLMTLLLALGLSESIAEVVEVPLPELRGRYYGEDTWTRYASFQMERAPISISVVSIRITGTLIIGELICESPGSGLMQPEPWPVDFWASMKDAANAVYWCASQLTPMVSGDFEITRHFQHIIGSGTWAFLLAGHGEVRLDGTGAMHIMLCSESVLPEATVTDAVLLIEGIFPIAANNNTWGSIKALFR